MSSISAVHEATTYPNNPRLNALTRRLQLRKRRVVKPPTYGHGVRPRGFRGVRRARQQAREVREALRHAGYEVDGYGALARQWTGVQAHTVVLGHQTRAARIADGGFPAENDNEDGRHGGGEAGWRREAC
jgi:hypothetical protein